MKFILCFLLIYFVNCQSLAVKEIDMKQTVNIPFEDQYHYPFPLIKNNFLVIDTQEKMDQIFAIIHQKTGGGRLAPIPTITPYETYIIIKPALKNTNDIMIQNVSLNKKVLTVAIKEFDNPDFKKENRTSPDILFKLLKKVSIKKITTKY